MIVNYGKNKTAVAEHGFENGITTLKTDPHPMGGMDHATVVLNLEAIMGASTGTPEIALKAEGSNDGVEYTEIADLTISSVTTKGLHTDSADVTFAFLRFKIELDAKTGSSGDWAAATYDIHANLIKK